MDSTKLLGLIHEVVLKIRLLRRYQQAVTAGTEELSEREIFGLQIISAFGPVTESQLGKVLGLQTSALADVIGRLLRRELASKGRSNADQRQRLLTLTKKGKVVLDQIKRKMAQRYRFLFKGCITREEVSRFILLLEQMNRNVDLEVDRVIFDRLPEEDEEAMDQSLWLPSFVKDTRTRNGKPMPQSSKQ